MRVFLRFIIRYNILPFDKKRPGFSPMKYTVTLQPSGHQFTVNENETILDAALEYGVTIPYGCRGGRCCACKGKLISGDIRYSEQPAGITREEMAQGDALFCKAMATSDLEIEVSEILDIDQIRPDRTPCKVHRLEKLSHDVIRLYLKLPDAKRIPFFAGQYLDIIQENGEHRSFSIANAPHDDDFIELHIRHVEGGEYTHHIFHELKEKDILRIEMPLGNFFLRENNERPIVMMGGGTGFAPLKSMIEHAMHLKLERPIHLFWGVRSLRDLYLAELPQEWARKYPLLRFTPVLSEPMKDDNWEGETGFVHEAVLKEYSDLSKFDIYMSGPPVMVYSARDAFMEAGCPQSQIYSDAFEFNSQMDSNKAVLGV